VAGHAYLNQVQDPATRAALQYLQQLITAQTTRIAQLEAAALVNTTTINANRQRVVNVANPQADTDAVNLGTVRALIAEQVESF
jgi:hypothetical protein